MCSYAGGPDKQAYALLQRFAKDLSFAEEGRDEILQLDQFGFHELDGIMSEIYLPTAPHKAILELRLLPGDWRGYGTEE